MKNFLTGSLAIAIVLIQGLGLVSGQQVNPHDPLITHIDPVELVTRIHSDAVLLNKATRYQQIGIVHQFQRSSTGQHFNVRLGIYPDVASAESGTLKVDVDGRRLRDVGDWNVFGAQSFNIRVKNAIVVIEIPRDLEFDRREEIALALAAALRDSHVVTTGSSVSAPRIEVLSAKTLAGDCAYEVFFAVAPETAKASRGELQQDGTWRVAGSIGWFDREFTLRVAAPNGVIAELSVSEFPRVAWDADSLRQLPNSCVIHMVD